MPIPAFSVPSPARRPKQAHSANENDGDTLAFQTEHAGEMGDQNVWVFYKRINRPASGIRFLLGHSGTLGQDGFTHIRRPFGLGQRRLTPHERARPKHLWTYGAAMRCRKPNGQRPVNLATALAHGKAVDFLIIPELKDPRFGREDVAAQFVAVFRRADVACWPKALVNLPGFKAKVAAFGKAGVTLAAIGGKHAQAEKRAVVAQARSERWTYQPHSW